MAHDVPITRENYIAAAWPEGFGDEGWTAEHEAELPAELRRRG